MRLWLLLVLTVVLLASAVTEAHPDIKLSTAGTIENMGVKTFLFGVDVLNPDNSPLQVSPGDFVASSPFGSYNLTGNTLKLDPGASGSLSLKASGAVSPRELVYRPNGESLSLVGRM